MFYTENELPKNSHARILLTGKPKDGKTTSLLCTAPGPIGVINCDGEGAPMAAIRHGAKDLKIWDVKCIEDWQMAVDTFYKMAAKDEIKTIVVDTITMLVNNIVAVEAASKFSGFDIWRETMNYTLRGVNRLFDAKAHVFFVAHYEISDGQVQLQGKLKDVMTALPHDRVHLDFDPKRTPSRQILLGPSASGLSGGRRSDESKAIDADFTKLLKELKYDI